MRDDEIGNRFEFVITASGQEVGVGEELFRRRHASGEDGLAMEWKCGKGGGGAIQFRPRSEKGLGGSKLSIQMLLARE